MLLSLAMIVRDAADDLAACLASARGLADEVVVLDTGSADGTAGVAAAAGARVASLSWPEDFAAARNAALDRCRGRWVAVLDADERLAPGAAAALRAWVAARDAEGTRAALRLETRNYLPRGVRPRGWRPTPRPDAQGLPAGSPAPGFVPSRKVRVFPRDAAVRFRGAVHETVEASVAEAGIPVVAGDAVVHHLGTLRDDPAKRARYRRLAAAKAERQPHDGGAWAELAEACLWDDDRAAALAAIARAARAEPDRPEHALTEGLLRLEAGAADVAWPLLARAAASPLLDDARRAEALHALGRIALGRGGLAEAGALLARAVRLEPQDGQIWNTLGVLAIRRGRGRDAVVALGRAAALRPGDAVPLLNLGILHDEAGQPGPARRYFAEAIASDPGCAEARRRLARLPGVDIAGRS